MVLNRRNGARNRSHIPGPHLLGPILNQQRHIFLVDISTRPNASAHYPDFAPSAHTKTRFSRRLRMSELFPVSQRQACRCLPESFSVLSEDSTAQLLSARRLCWSYCSKLSACQASPWPQRQ